MTYQNYEFTAFSEADLLSGGDTNLGCGDTFVMPAAATTCITVCDDDPFLSGDSACNENSDDRYGQKASIEGPDGELGNGGQIYAECYYWVKDQYGNYYVLIEIEQEGTGDDYFTFHSGYGMPPAGAQLTIVSSGNVTSNWIDYKCLDAGEKVELGSISGSVFCDVDCDGINGETVVIPGCDYVLEAESMHKWNMSTFHSSTASGGAGVKLYCAGDTGAIWDSFEGKKGTYDIKIKVQDECDGQSVIKLKVNGVFVEAFRLDNDNNGGGSNNGSFSTYVIRDVALNTGDEVKLVAYGDRYEYVRIDKLVFEGQDETVTTTEPVKAGVVIKLLDAATGDVVATTETDANGDYRFDDVPAGDYKIMGVAPDGTEFTIQDAGSDDSIDSDVDGSGMSGVISVTGGSETDIDLGVCEIKPGSLSGRYFCDDNRNGVDDAEPGVAGVLVQLLNAAGDVIADTTTAGDGSYSFGNLAPGTYSVKFTDTVSGKQLVDPNVGADDSIDSDAEDLGNGMSLIAGIVVAAGQNTPDNDAGVEAIPGSLSGTYFCDENENDINDAGDTAVAGRLVTLLNADGTPAVDIDGNAVATTETDANGNYRFTNLAAGSYVVMFALPTDAEGKEFVAPDVGDDTTDSDVTNVFLGKTDPVEVNAGMETENVDAGIADINDAPTPQDDEGMVCVGESTVIDLLANDSDPEGDALSVTSLADADESVGVGGTITLASGATATLNANGTVSIDASAAAPDLLIGETLVDEFVYHVSDGELTSEAGVDLTLKGAKNTVETIDANLGEVGIVTAGLGYDATPGGDYYTLEITEVEFAASTLGTVLSSTAALDLVFCLSIATPISTLPDTNDFTVAVLDADSYSQATVGTEQFIGSDFGFNPQNADNVNWLLNEADDLLANGYTEGEIQVAIWNLLDGGADSRLTSNFLRNYFADNAVFGDAADAEALTQLALANDGFVAEAGDVVGVIFDPVEDGVQPLVAGIAFDLLSEDCIC